MAGRFFYEDRCSGEMQWQKKHRGGTEVYGESIYTKRWELLGAMNAHCRKMLFLSYRSRPKFSLWRYAIYGKTTHWFTVDLGQKTEQARFAFRLLCVTNIMMTTPLPLQTSMPLIPYLFRTKLNLMTHHKILLAPA
jgi:outer membrane receptor for ferrienterochelin and colicins